MRDFNSGLAVLAQRLQQRAETKNVIVTLGAEGLLIYAPAVNGGGVAHRPAAEF